MKDINGLEVEVGDNVFFSTRGETKEGCVLDGRGKVVRIESMHMLGGTGGTYRDMAHIWVEGNTLSNSMPYKRSYLRRM